MIHVTAVRPPDVGWPMAYRCTLCGVTVFLHSPWAAKPEKGDYFVVTDLVCPNEVRAHNLRFMFGGGEVA